MIVDYGALNVNARAVRGFQRPTSRLRFRNVCFIGASMAFSVSPLRARSILAIVTPLQIFATESSLDTWFAIKCHVSESKSAFQGTMPVNSLHTIHLTSVADLRAEAAAWDDLWQRSDVSLPLVRAELLAQWVEHFAPRADFHAAGRRRPVALGRRVAAGLVSRRATDFGGRTPLQPLGDVRRSALRCRGRRE